MSASTLPVTDPEVAPRRLAAQVADAEWVIGRARRVVDAHRSLDPAGLAWAMIGLTLSLLEYDLNNPAVPDARRD